MCLIARIHTSIKLYNTAIKRMTAVHDMNERRQKVLQVQKEGLEFHKHFVLAFGQTAVTPYVHCIVLHLAQQIMVIKGDWSDYSAQRHSNTRTKSARATGLHHIQEANDERRHMAGPGNDPVQGFRTLRDLHWEFLRLWTAFELSDSCTNLPGYAPNLNRNILDFYEVASN
jgi:hypothetical protein